MEARGAAGQPVEGEVRQVAQVRQVQLLQTGQSRPHLEEDNAALGKSEDSNWITAEMNRDVWIRKSTCG